MIDKIFWEIMNCISNILKFVIVFLILGFLILLPFLLKGGWAVGILIYGYIGNKILKYLAGEE